MLQFSVLQQLWGILSAYKATFIYIYIVYTYINIYIHTVWSTTCEYMRET